LWRPGLQPVWNDEREPIASMFYTFYERSDVGDKSTRPLVISFNGGPGSASIWMHIAYTGPRLLKIDDEGFPVQPYGIQENTDSILDVADIVYVDPVNTGFSRILDDASRSQFFGVNEDISYLARWLETFVTRHGRWTSPKFLIGESYGTTRVAGLAARLQAVGVHPHVEHAALELVGLRDLAPDVLDRAVDEDAEHGRCGLRHVAFLSGSLAPRRET